MSSENVEIVRRSLAAYARRDEAALHGLVDVDFELDWTRSIGWLTGIYRGIDETLRFYAGYFEAFREIVVKPDASSTRAIWSSCRTRLASGAGMESK